MTTLETGATTFNPTVGGGRQKKKIIDATKGSKLLTLNDWIKKQKATLVPKKITVHPKEGKPFERIQMVRPEGSRPFSDDKIKALLDKAASRKFGNHLGWLYDEKPGGGAYLDDMVEIFKDPLNAVSGKILNNYPELKGHLVYENISGDIENYFNAFDRSDDPKPNIDVFYVDEIGVRFDPETGKALEVFEGSDEASSENIRIVNEILYGNKPTKLITVYSSQPTDVIDKIKQGNIPKGIFVSPKREVAEKYWGEGRDVISFKVDPKMINQISDIDWQILDEVKKSSDMPDPYSQEIYDWVDATISKAGLQIPGKLPQGSKKIGKQLEGDLYSSLRDKIAEYLEMLRPDIPQYEVINGVMDVVQSWTDTVKGNVDEAFNDLYIRGLTAGIVDAGIRPAIGLADKLVMCLTGDTQISLMDGTEKRVDELSLRTEGYYIYGFDLEKGLIIPSLATPAKVTGIDVPVYEVFLDNGTSFKVTGEHLILMRDGKYKKVSDLNENDSVMPLYRKFNAENVLKDYEVLYQPNEHKWQYTHRMIFSPPERKGKIIHHKDFNCRNNDPRNVIPMTQREHVKLHAAGWNKNLTKETDSRVKQISDSTKGRVPWNKDKTKENDVRVALLGKKVSLRRRELSAKGLLIPWNKGLKWSEEVKLKLRKPKAVPSYRKGQTWEETFGEERAAIMRLNHKGFSGKSHSEDGLAKIRGVVQEMRNNISKGTRKNMDHIRGKTLEELYGKDKADRIKASSGKNQPTKGKTYEEFYGIEKALEIKNKMKVAERPRDSNGKFISKNHKIISVKFYGIVNKVYDIQTETNNFALTNGIFVHNSFIKANPMRIGSRIVTFSQDLVEKFRPIIANSFTAEGIFNVDYLTNELNKVVPAKRYLLERIVRTEVAAISQVGRLIGWNSDNYKHFYNYRWNSTRDNRTKPISLRRAAGNPYAWCEICWLWERQEELRPNGRREVDWPNQRCSLSRTPSDTEVRGFRFRGQEINYPITTPLGFIYEFD